MIIMISGLAVFFGLHFFSAARSRDPERDIKHRLGYGPYMGLYSLLSVLGFGLMIYGYAQMAGQGPALYALPLWTHTIVHIANLIAITFLIAAYIPRNRIKQFVRHPMVVGLIIWSAAHLLTPTTLRDLLLFGSFLAFGLFDAVFAFRRASPSSDTPSILSDLITLAGGAAVYAGLVFWAHQALIGVAPM